MVKLCDCFDCRFHRELQYSLNKPYDEQIIDALNISAMEFSAKRPNNDEFIIHLIAMIGSFMSMNRIIPNASEVDGFEYIDGINEAIQEYLDKYILSFKKQITKSIMMDQLEGVIYLDGENKIILEEIVERMKAKKAAEAEKNAKNENLDSESE